MPELPEMAGLAQFLETTVVGTRVAEVQVAALSAVKTADPPLSAAVDRLVVAARRRGKWLELQLGDEQPLFLLVHLSRAGWLVWRDDPPTGRVRMGSGPLAARLTFADQDGVVSGALDFTEAGSRKRLAIHLVTAPEQVQSVAELGPDALSEELTEADFAQLLQQAGRRQLKSVLCDQRTVAGIGNAYSDEILHTARLSPTARCDSLTDAETAQLYQSMRDVLTAAIGQLRGLSPSEFKDSKRSGLAVHGRTGEACPVCGTTIREVASADSSYQYCPGCQTSGRILADRRMSRLLK